MKSLLLSLPAFAFFAATSMHAQDAIPSPPMQGKPWAPPDTKLSSTLVKSVKELFDQGMADPRGCEYREVEIDPWGNGERKTKVHAWVLPGDGKVRYAVGWNGRVNPVTSVGDLVDLRKDFSADTHGLGGFGGYGSYDDRSLSQQFALPIKVALLLRLGEADLAEGVWNEGYKGNGNMLANDPYSEIAREWLVCWYNRALTAHLNGDDSLALAMLRPLVALKKKVAASADEHGVTGVPSGAHYLDEITQLDDLLADQERRAKEPPHTPALQANLPEGPERIVALVRDLELVHGEQMMNPGETELTMDPIVQALIKEGEPAVEPLIACLDEDPPRMTHTMFTQGMMGSGPVEYVYEPAYVVLTAILKTTMLIPLAPGTNPHQLSLTDRKALAAKFRVYWGKYKSMSLPERWYSVLADDNATPQEWFEAADNIVQRVGAQGMGPHLFSGGSWRGGQPGPSAPMRGEPLRNKTNPSVSDLIIKRFHETLPQAGKVKHLTFGAVGNLLFALADWDGKGRLDDFKAMGRDFYEASGHFSTDDPEMMDPPFSGHPMIAFFEKRADLGDSAALREYGDWLLASPARDTDSLRLLWKNPSDPEALKIADALFAGKPTDPHEYQNFAGLVTTPMLGIPVFRQLVGRALDDKRAAVTDPQQAQNPSRVCDYYAASLARVLEFPDFQYGWPEEQRDAVVAKSKAFLNQYGDDYRINHFDNAATATVPHLVLPKLGHPATPEDVAAGRAIFSLKGETRAGAVDPFPLYAKYIPAGADPKAAQEVNVWQAEDVKVDGKWERYFGIQGRHLLQKVPASEIQFPVFYQGDTVITPQIEGHLDSTDDPGVHQIKWNSFAVVGAGVPLPVVLNLHNHDNADQEIPANLIPPANTPKVLPAGITLSLEYSNKTDVKNTPEGLGWQGPVFMMGGAPVPFDYGTWNDVPPRKEAASEPAAPAAEPIEAGCVRAILKIDLRDFFDTSRPGTYRVHAVIQAPGGGITKTGYIEFTVLEDTK